MRLVIALVPTAGVLDASGPYHEVEAHPCLC